MRLDPFVRVAPPKPEYVDRVRFNHLQRVAIQQIAAGDSEGADETLGEISEDHYKHCSSILLAKAATGDLAGALAMLPAIKDESDRGYALQSVTQQMTKAGKENDALALVEQQTSSTWKAYALLGILAAGIPEEGKQE